MLKVKRKKILVVDDDSDYLFQISNTLQEMEFEVITAKNQIETQNIIDKVRPDLAIIDLIMENQDTGFILCHFIKRKYPDLPVIIASAVTAVTGMMFDLNSDPNQQWIKADLFLDKGFRKDQLHKEINKLLKI